MKTKKIFFVIIIIFNILFCNYSYGATFKADSPSAIVFNRNTGKILYEKNAHEKKYPASTTKIMTAILTLENCNLDDKATVSTQATILPAGYISANLQPGEVLTIDELLHLLLIISSNDAANVLAEHIAGSVNNFADMMNNKAKEIGCLNTHFVNANGAHNINHYSTAYDLCLIANYAMNNNVFRQLVSTASYTVPATNKYQERELFNTNLLIQKNNKKTKTKNIYYYELATGIKTGYTDFAKNCLVASAKKDDVEFISVVLGASSSETDNNSQRFSDSKDLLKTAIENYSLYNIGNINDIVTTVKIPNAAFWKKDLNLLLENNITTLMENQNLDTKLSPKVTLYEDKLNAPISKGDVLGTVTYIYDGTSYTENIIAENDVSDNQVLNNVLIIALAFAFIIIIFKIRKNRNKRRYKRRK